MQLQAALYSEWSDLWSAPLERYAQTIGLGGGDINYIRTATGWLYMAAFIDLFSRMEVGGAMATHMEAMSGVRCVANCHCLSQPCAWRASSTSRWSVSGSISPHKGEAAELPAAGHQTPGLRLPAKIQLAQVNFELAPTPRRQNGSTALF